MCPTNKEEILPPWRVESPLPIQPRLGRASGWPRDYSRGRRVHPLPASRGEGGSETSCEFTLLWIPACPTRRQCRCQYDPYGAGGGSESWGGLRFQLDRRKVSQLGRAISGERWMPGEARIPHRLMGENSPNIMMTASSSMGQPHPDVPRNSSLRRRWCSDPQGPMPGPSLAVQDIVGPCEGRDRRGQPDGRDCQ